MILIKYNNSKEYREVTFKRVSDNVVKISEKANCISNTSGFDTYSIQGKKLGTFSDYNTVYHKTQDSVWYSRDGSTIGLGRGAVEDAEIYVKPMPTADEIRQMLINGVQIHMDEIAQEKGYDGILSACSYINSGVAKFDEEGEKARQWRSLVWQKCFEVLENYDEYSIGQLELETLISELPSIEW